MKKLVYVLITTGFIGSITAQRISEPLIATTTTIEPEVSVISGSYHNCFGSTNTIAQLPNDLIDNMYTTTFNGYATRIDHVDMVVDGIPVDHNAITTRKTEQENNVEEVSVIVGGIPAVYSDINRSSIVKITEKSTLSTQKAFVKGTIMDKDDNPAIATILISGENLKNGFTGAETDEYGRFGIELPVGTYHVKFSSLGYKDIAQTIQIEKGKNFNVGTIHLQESDIKITCGTRIVSVINGETMRIPCVKGESEFVEVLSVIGCPATIDESNKVVEKVEADRFISRPFTGLEGHNFIEEPAIIYPNPVRDILNIKSTDPITVIEILNVHGQVEKSLDPTTTMDVSLLAAGTYYARIHFENRKNVQVEKILLVK
jgi:hypothetical protein